MKFTTCVGISLTLSVAAASLSIANCTFAVSKATTSSTAACIHACEDQSGQITGNSTWTDSCDFIYWELESATGEVKVYSPCNGPSSYGNGASRWSDFTETASDCAEQCEAHSTCVQWTWNINKSHQLLSYMKECTMRTADEINGALDATSANPSTTYCPTQGYCTGDSCLKCFDETVCASTPNVNSMVTGWRYCDASSFDPCNPLYDPARTTTTSTTTKAATSRKIRYCAKH